MSAPATRGARSPKRTKPTAANEAEENAFEALITLSPVTIPGLRAAMHYFIEFETECIPGATDKFLTALLASPLLLIGRA